MKPLPQPTRLPIHLLAPATGAPQPVLAQAGPGQGQVVQLVQRREDAAGLLIHDALRAEAPAARAGQARIAAGHQVMGNASRPQLHGGIGQGAEGLSRRPKELGLQKGGQPLQGDGIALGRLTLHKSLPLRQPPELIQTPHQTPLLKGGGFAHPAQEAMHRRMHPGQLARPVVETAITAHPPAQQITQQQLLGTGQGLRSESERASPNTCNRHLPPQGRAPLGCWPRCSACAPAPCRWPSSRPVGSER